jgi:hypothetical protein
LEIGTVCRIAKGLAVWTFSTRPEHGFGTDPVSDLAQSVSGQVQDTMSYTNLVLASLLGIFTHGDYRSSGFMGSLFQASAPATSIQR